MLHLSLVRSHSSNFLYYSQNCNKPFLFCSNKMSTASILCSGSFTFIANILSIFHLLNHSFFSSTMGRSLVYYTGFPWFKQNQMCWESDSSPLAILPQIANRQHINKRLSLFLEMIFRIILYPINWSCYNFSQWSLLIYDISFGIWFTGSSRYFCKLRLTSV